MDLYEQNNYTIDDIQALVFLSISLMLSSSSSDTSTKKESLTDYSIKLSLTKKAATYSPALHCSTIGASGLNFSVRNGKRWNTTAITA